MARTTPAQKPRGEHSKTFSAGLFSVAAPVMRTSFDALLRHSTWAAPRLLSSEAVAIPVRAGFIGNWASSSHRDLCVARLSAGAEPRLVARVQLCSMWSAIVMHDRRQRAARGFEASRHVPV